MDLLRAMRVFVAVAETEGFVSAARALGMSTSAVSRDVGALEQELGGRLLIRTTRRIRLTEAGRGYLADARRILGEIAEAESSFSGAHGLLRGPLSVTAPATFGRLHVAPHVVAFARRHPQVIFTTLFLDRVVDLLEEGVDVAVRIGELPDSSAIAVRVGTVRQTCYASPVLLAEVGEPKTPHKLEALSSVELANYGSPWRFRVEGKSCLVRPRTRFTANTVECAIEAAVAGCGVVRLLSYQAAHAVAGGLLVPILTSFEPDPLPVHILHMEGRSAAMRTRSFVNYLAGKLRATEGLRR